MSRRLFPDGHPPGRTSRWNNRNIVEYEGGLVGGPKCQHDDNVVMAGQGAVAAPQAVEIKIPERISEQFDSILKVVFMIMGFEVTRNRSIATASDCRFNAMVGKIKLNRHVSS